MSPRRRVGRPPIRRVVFGLRARVPLEALREAGLDDCVYVGHEFRPLIWEIRGNRVWLTCLAKRLRLGGGRRASSTQKGG
jgi:hypothetical protein